MVLTVTAAAFFSALGFAAWIAGSIFGQKGIAVIGGAVVLILGAGVVTGGLHQPAGQVEENQYTTVNGTNETVVNETTVSTQYQQISNTDSDRVGFVVLILGATMVMRGLDMEQPL